MIFNSALLSGHEVGSAVFIHPDGTGLGHWNAARLLYAGPDGDLNWDRMDRLAAYRVHQSNWLGTTSHAGATVHAYGRKVHHDSFGLDRDQPITALSGKNMTLMEEAMSAGIRTGVINSGHIGEPGSAVFLARSEDRDRVTEIAVQVIHSGADLVFSGGEKFLIPKGTVGKHGVEGVRDDGRDLLSEARARGYTVIFSREELLQLPAGTEKVVGIFAASHTFNATGEDELRRRGLPPYNPEAPTMSEMVQVALRVLGSDPQRAFFLVAEEEGTDNFSNSTNAAGMLAAVERTDEAIGETLEYMRANPERNLSLVVGSDSDAGHPAILSPKNWDAQYRLPETTSTGAALDGPEGLGGRPFWSKPDANGNRFPFGIAWPASNDQQGSTVTKMHGYRSHLLPASIDNTDIYKLLYQVLFGQFPADLESGD